MLVLGLLALGLGGCANWKGVDRQTREASLAQLTEAQRERLESARKAKSGMLVVSVDEPVAEMHEGMVRVVSPNFERLEFSAGDELVVDDEEIQRRMVQEEAFSDAYQQRGSLFTGIHFVGSAAAVSREGHFLTANHCLTGGPYYIITIGPGKKPVVDRAWVAFQDEAHDLAILKVDRPLESYYACREEPLTAGERIYLGPVYAGSAGTVKRVESTGFNDAFFRIVAEAPARRGFSGSPMLDMEGRLAGVASSISPFFELGDFSMTAYMFHPVALRELVHGMGPAPGDGASSRQSVFSPSPPAGNARR